jgi:hypothetical protein
MEALHHSAHLTEEIIILRKLGEAGLLAKLEHPHGIVVGAMPERGVQMAEE